MGINQFNILQGEAYSPLISNKLSISASICYEIAFNELVRKTAKSSNLLVTISNDTWFGASIGPEQHLEIAQSRALEHQKSLIRATNSGISAIIDRRGKIVKRQGFFEKKELKGEISIYEGKTPFSIIGNYFIYGYIILIYMYLFKYKRTYVLKILNIMFFKHIAILFVKILPLLLTLFITSCTVITEKPINNMILDSLKSISLDYKDLDLLIAVNIRSQELFLLSKGNIEQVYSISTSAYGTGSKENSFKTPLGKHKISEKIGKGITKRRYFKG